MKKQLNKILITCLFITVISGSCNEGTIDLIPLQPTEEDYFKNQVEFERAVVGVYAKLVRFYSISNFGDFGGSVDVNSNVHSIELLTGDDITMISTEPMETFNINSGNPKIATFFTTCYAMIGRAAFVLEKIEAAEGVYTDETLRNYNKGEMLFLRGFANYQLWNVFGTAPLVTERVTDAGFRPPSSTGTELLDQAILDFQAAADLLPAAWPASQIGRATANSANGFLGKSLVFRGSATNTPGDYAAALTALNKISGRTLIAAWDDNFAVDAENNAESLFEFQSSTNDTENIWVGDPDAWDAIGAMSAFWDFYRPAGQQKQNSNNAPWTATEKLEAAFDPADPRKDLTMNANREIQKYITRDTYASDNLGSLNNVRVLRLADAILLKAEAALKSGGSKAEAIGYINEVRTRARAITGSTEPANYSTAETNETTIMNWIKNERFIELAGEGQRWYDIRRWYIGEHLADPSVTLTKAFFDSDALPANFLFRIENIYFPIPNAETNVNRNIVQNPGY